jgi:hypothetical protein
MAIDTSAGSGHEARRTAQLPEAGEISVQQPRNGRPHQRLRVHLACIGVIVALSLAWFFPLLTGSSFSAVPGYLTGTYPWAATDNGQVFYPQSDQAALNYPWQSALTDALKEGTVPWWNAESFAGQPLFANGSSTLLYPPRLLLAETVSPTTAHNVLSVLHVTLAGLFCYWLLAELELSPLAALFGSVAWMFGAFTLGWLQLEVVAPLFAWLPAGLVTMRRAVLRSARWIVASAASIALLLVSTHLLFADVCVVVIGLYGACVALRPVISRWRQRHGVRAFGPLARVLGSSLLGFGLAAFVLVPTAYVLGSVSRQSLPFSEINLFDPFSLSDLRYALWPAPLPITEHEMEWGLGFAGSLTVLLALIGFFTRHKGAGLGRVLAIGSVLAAIGGPVGYLVYRLIPGMNVFRPYGRLLFLFDLGLAVLGGIGLDVVIRRLAGSTPVGDSPAKGLFLSHNLRWWMSRGIAVAVIAVTALQLGLYGRDINPPFQVSRSSFAFRTTPLIRALETGRAGVAGWSNRVFPANDVFFGTDLPMLYGNESMVFGIDSAGGYDSSVPARTVDIWRVVNGEHVAAVVGSKLIGAFQPKFDVYTADFDLLPRLGIDRIALTPKAAMQTAVTGRLQELGWERTYSGADGTVYAYTGPPTGPTVVFDVRRIENDTTALGTFTEDRFDFARTVILDEEGGSSYGPAGTFRILSARQGVNSARVVVRASKPGWLVVPSMWDPGWSATVNGSATDVQRADYNEQAVAVPAGRSVVQLRYRPPGLEQGVVASGLSLLACIAILVWPLWPTRWKRSRS